MRTDTSSEQAIDEESTWISWETWDRIKHTEWFVLVVATLFAALFPYVVASMPVLSDTILHMNGRYSTVHSMLLWMIFALSFNLLLGQTGLLSFGHAMFWAGAGYGGAWFAINAVAEPFLIVVAGTLFATLLAAGSALILLRLHTVYFAIVSLAIAQFIYWLANSAIQDLSVLGLDLGTGGNNGRRISTDMEPLFFAVELGDSLIYPLSNLWHEMMYLFLAAFFVGAVVFITRVRKSPYGLLFKAIRENETRASFVGLDVWRYKFSAFVLSGALAGLAGALNLIDSGSITVSRAHWTVSGDLVMTTVLGGLGTLVGPITGSFVYYYFSDIVSGFDEIPIVGTEVPIIDIAFGRLWLMMLAITFTVVVWLYPAGLWGMITAVTAKLRGADSEGGDH